MHRLKAFISSPIWQLWRSCKHALVLFAAIFLCNLIAAFLEGASFGAFFCALSLANHSKNMSLSLFPSLFDCLSNLPPSHIFFLFLILAVGIQLLRSLFSFFSQTMITKLSNRLRLLAQMRIYDQIFRLSFQCANSYRIGDLIDYATAPQSLFNALLDCVNKVLTGGLASLILLVYLFKLSSALTLIVLFSGVAIYLIQKKLIARVATDSDQATQAQVEISKLAVQSFSAIRTVFTFNLQTPTLKKVLHKLKEHAHYCDRAYLRVCFISNLNELMGVLLIGACLVGGSLILDADKVDVFPLLLTFIGTSYRLTTRLQMAIQSTAAMLQQWGTLLRLHGILIDKGKEFAPTHGIPFLGLKDRISFESLSFAYQHAQNTPVLHRLSFTIQKGTTVAIVGSSGAGKSTVADLVARLFDPLEGAILIDGVDLRCYNPISWRKSIGVVNQDPFIFSDTIFANINLYEQAFSEEEAMQAAKTAEAHGFISRLPHGYSTEVGERGYRLSTGEKQRIALARALLHNPEILILDEATSNLDSHSEKQIQLALTKFNRKKTLLVIAHRLSTIQNADQIFVLENGTIIENGTHNQLLSIEGRYAYLWALQASQRQKNSDAFSPITT